MHETDMTKALILTIREWMDEPANAEARSPSENASKLPIAKIKTVHLTVGEFTCVEPASLQFAFSAQTKGTCLEGVQLQIKEVPLIAFCHPCGQTYRPQVGAHYACPQCQSPMEDIRSGRELKIDRFEVISEEVISEEAVSEEAVSEEAISKAVTEAASQANEEKELAQSGV